jgi:hypothetical protein
MLKNASRSDAIKNSILERKAFSDSKNNSSPEAFLFGRMKFNNMWINSIGVNAVFAAYSRTLPSTQPMSISLPAREKPVQSRINCMKNLCVMLSVLEYLIP